MNAHRLKYPLGPSSFSAASLGGASRVAVAPPLGDLEDRLQYRGRDLVIRPLRPEDISSYRRFLAQIERQDLYTRFFVYMRQLPEEDVIHLTHIDYDREMAFVAVACQGAGESEILGVARVCSDPGNVAAEFAVLVRSDLKHQGLGSILVQKLIRYCRARGVQRLWANVLCENTAMLHLAKSVGFQVRSSEGNMEVIELNLQDQG